MFVNFVACVPVAAAGALVALGANSSNPRMATTTAVAIDDDALRNLPMRPCLLVRRGQWIGVGRMGPAGSFLDSYPTPQGISVYLGTDREKCPRSGTSSAVRRTAAGCRTPASARPGTGTAGPAGTAAASSGTRTVPSGHRAGRGGPGPRSFAPPNRTGRTRAPRSPPEPP